ncbi:M14 family zinc carboxypeptidase [Caballeronia humi]|uniref:Carboxypeptidase T n=1 Tax=Caballeronia humi TaxID=326474 RepID=A0A158ICP4_9BURK|nr:M14 family zinc carboxypeptidase [Caballeronia humi]SAL53901.1 Carboxypeptidase T precursor [Caballeronia humi]
MSYLNIVEVESAIANLAGAYPALTSLVALPNPSIEGRTSHALRISNGGFGTRDAVMMIGGVHAREWGSCEILINFATDLLSAYTNNAGLQYGGKTFSAATVQGMVNTLEFVVYPLVNPDGRLYSQQHDAAILNGWRKNRNTASSGGDPNRIGVDINRNYDFLWDFASKMAPSSPGASSDPADETFHGTGAFSEPETRNVQWLVDAVPRTRWFIDVHSYSELILYNWGDDQNQSNDPAMNFRNAAWDGKRGVRNDVYAEYIPSDDEAVAAALANRMKAAITAVRGRSYTAEPSYGLYPTSGASDDYVYARHWLNPAKAKTYGFVIEWGTRFHPAWSEMELIIDDISAALIDFCAAAPCAGGVIAVGPLNTRLSFVDIPAGTETARAVVFSAQSCQPLTLQVTAGPALTSGPGTLGLPFGGLLSLPAAPDATTREVRLWVSYKAGAAGTSAAGSVTVSCPQTGAQWVIPITANAIPKPNVASMLVLDRSGSMDDPSGIPGKKRIDVLHDAAPTFVELLGDTDGIGVVAFDQDAALRLAVTQAGPVGFGTGRVQAKSAISSHLTNPLGSTSIGDGVELAHDSLVGAAGYAKKAVVVFTDGEENTAKFIADIASKIDDRVFAIGLGTVGQLNPVALSKLVNNTGGYLMLTGPLGASEQFRVAKYYLQILSGVVNSQIVVDPEGYVNGRDVVRIPFDLTEADTSTDVVLLSPLRRLLNFRVETPMGDLIDPASVASLVDSSFVPGTGLDAYRLSLPAIWPTHSAHAGRWYARLELGGGAGPGISDVQRDLDVDRSRVVSHGVPFSVTVQARSSLTMTAEASARRPVPATVIDHRVTLRQLDLPLDRPASVIVEATDPTGAMSLVQLADAGPGAFIAQTDASVAGVYVFRYVARGRSFAGVPFMREQVRTVGVWAGGDDPPPRSGSGGDGDTCCSGVIQCLLEDRGVRELMKRFGIDAQRLAECLKKQKKGGG